jgi:hypothetical protein
MDGRSGKVTFKKQERFFGNPKVGKSVVGFLNEQRIFGNNSKMWWIYNFNTVSIILKRVSKRSSFRYRFQEHLVKFLMLAVTHSEWLLGDHCTSRHLNSKLAIVRLVTSATNPLSGLLCKTLG